MQSHGHGSSRLRLVLVTNPVGADVRGSQASLETEWKQERGPLHRIRFDALYCTRSMPIGDFWNGSSALLEYLELEVPDVARHASCAVATLK